MEYRELTQEQRKHDLQQHAEWLKDNEKGARLDWSGCKLQSADLQSADLRYANLRSADLQSANLLIIGPIGTRMTCLYVTFGDDICCTTGCFRGTLAEFANAVKETHPDDIHGKQYKAAIAFIKATAKLRK